MTIKSPFDFCLSMSLQSLKLFKSLKAPRQRVGNLNTPIPVASKLIEAVMPTKEKIIAAVNKTLV